MGFRVESLTQREIIKPPPLNRDYNRDPNLKALKSKGVIDHGFTLRVQGFRFRVRAHAVPDLGGWGGLGLA